MIGMVNGESNIQNFLNEILELEAKIKDEDDLDRELTATATPFKIQAKDSNESTNPSGSHSCCDPFQTTALGLTELAPPSQSQSNLFYNQQEVGRTEEQYERQRAVASISTLRQPFGQKQGIVGKPNKTYIREIAGKKWIDSTLADWPDHDNRIFCGNLSKDVTDELLSQHFAHYPSFAKARVVRDKYTKGSKGYGFVSFLDVMDFSRALNEMEGTYIINRPCKLRKSSWDERTRAVIEDGKIKKRKPLTEEHHVLKAKGNNPLHVIPHIRNKKHHMKGVPSFVYASDGFLS